MSDGYGLRAFNPRDEGTPVALKDGRKAFVDAVYPDGRGEFAAVSGPRLPAGGAVVHRSDVRLLRFGSDWRVGKDGRIELSALAERMWLSGAKGDPSVFVAVFRGEGGDVAAVHRAMEARKEGSA